MHCLRESGDLEHWAQTSSGRVDEDGAVDVDGSSDEASVILGFPDVLGLPESAMADFDP